MILRILIYSRIMAVVLIAFLLTYSFSSEKVLMNIFMQKYTYAHAHKCMHIYKCAQIVCIFSEKIDHLEDTSRLNSCTHS